MEELDCFVASAPRNDADDAAPPTAVIPAKAGIQYAASFSSITSASEYWMPACAGMMGGYTSAFSRQPSPEFCKFISSSKKRAQGRPGARLRDQARPLRHWHDGQIKKCCQDLFDRSTQADNDRGSNFVQNQRSPTSTVSPGPSGVPSGTTARIEPDASVWVSVTESRRARGEKPPAIATALSTLILGT
jgi:hypothetical protein